jgi:glutathione S-transferase
MITSACHVAQESFCDVPSKLGNSRHSVMNPIVLHALHPEPPLMGTNARDKAIVEMWERRANEEGMLPASELFRNTHPQFAERGLPGAADAIPAIPTLRDGGRSRPERFFVKFDRQLADNTFVAGERFTIADATTLAAVDFAGWSDVKIPASCRHLQRWYDQVNQRPSAKA